MYGADDNIELSDEQKDNAENINNEEINGDDELDVDIEDIESANENSLERMN
jgi:hypothetical protein